MTPSLLERRRIIRARKIAACASTLAATGATLYYALNLNEVPRNISRFTGEQWMIELLSGHPSRIRDNLGLSQAGFRYLEKLLIRKSRLKSTRYMGTTEQLGIFLYTVVTDLSMRKLAERFQRSTETISRTYHKVLKYFLHPKFYQSLIQFPTAPTPLAENIQNREFCFPYFKDCIGVVDGTHIPVLPPENERVLFRNRKGFLSQNVLAACDFELRFITVLSGWEGSASDSTLWLEGRRAGILPIPEGNYLLGDAGFANCDTCITPYRGVKYHLKEWEKENQEPQTKEELFNLRHSKLRNIVERMFGVMKARFKILTLPRAFKMEAQARVVAALCVLYNILVDLKEVDDSAEIENVGNAEPEDSTVIQEHRGYIITTQETQRASGKRDEIATAIWNDYLARKTI